MVSDNPPVTFDRLTELETDGMTLIEGLPGHGLVAAIAVDQITKQLGLEHHGSIRSAAFPPVASFLDGRVQDLVRVYARADPPVMTLQSDVVLPPASFSALSQCILDDLVGEFEQAVFLAGAPVQRESQRGQIFGVATTAAMEADLESAGIELARGNGLIGGVTGAIVSNCYSANVPAAVLIVGANPFIPDPGASRTLIEDALEPLVRFDIDTTELKEQADEIQERMEQVARQYQQMAQEQEGEPVPQSISPSMYQ